MTAPPRPRPATDARPRNPARPVAGRSRRARPPAVAHAAADPGDAQARQSGPAVARPQAEPPQTEGATAPIASADGHLVKVVEGLRGVVTRWERAGLGTLALVSFQRLGDGRAIAPHPRTVERHRGCAVAWVRGEGRRTP